MKSRFKSGLEAEISKQLINKGINPQYEQIKLPYVIPETQHTYTPDFPVSSTIIIETKGRFLTADRQKMLRLKNQYPDIDFRFIFSNSKSKINKKSTTTYADWCIKNGFKYSDKSVPDEWIKEIKYVLKKQSSRCTNK